MGDIGHFICAAACGYDTGELLAGCGMEACVTLRRCPSCTAVYAQTTVHDWLELPPAEEVCCASCGGRELVDAPELEELVEASDGHANDFATARAEAEPRPAAPIAPCPRCAAPLRWQLLGLWD